MPRLKSANYLTSLYIRQSDLNRYYNNTKFAAHLIVLSSVDFSHANIISEFPRQGGEDYELCSQL
jgi:hypothetical protein